MNTYTSLILDGGQIVLYLQRWKHERFKDEKIHQNSNMHEKDCKSRKLRVDSVCVFRKFK